MDKATKPDATGQAGEVTNADIMCELFNLHCIAEGMRALAVEAGEGEISILARFLAGRALELHNRIDAADVARIGGAK